MKKSSWLRVCHTITPYFAVSDADHLLAVQAAGSGGSKAAESRFPAGGIRYTVVVRAWIRQYSVNVVV